VVRWPGRDLDGEFRQARFAAARPSCSAETRCHRHGEARMIPQGTNSAPFLAEKGFCLYYHRHRTHMGSLWSRLLCQGGIRVPLVLVSDSRSEPFDMTRPGFLPDPIQLTYGRRLGRQHQDPACGGRGSGGRSHSRSRLLRAISGIGSSTRDPPGRDQVLGMGRLGLKDAAQAAFITAPSMTTPEVTYFHSATSSLRARAVIVTFLRRPPSRLTRSSNHRVSADCG
jgi:hypothetical protein